MLWFSWLEDIVLLNLGKEHHNITCVKMLIFFLMLIKKYIMNFNKLKLSFFEHLFDKCTAVTFIVDKISKFLHLLWRRVQKSDM